MPAKRLALDICLWVMEWLKLPAAVCLVCEGFETGLTAARGAGLATVVTPAVTGCTHHQRFAGAATLLPSLEEAIRPPGCGAG